MKQKQDYNLMDEDEDDEYSSPTGRKKSELVPDEKTKPIFGKLDLSKVPK